MLLVILSLLFSHRPSIQSYNELSDANIVQLNRSWDTATDIANISVDLARAVHYEPTDRPYTLGLFHNCAIPLMMMRYENYFSVMEESYGHPDKRVIDTENDLLDPTMP